MDWEHGRRAVGISAAHWEPEGLTDYNPKSLTRSVAPGCWCVIFSSSTVNGNRACHGGPFTGKMYRSAQNPAHTSHPCAAVRTSWRFSRCRSGHSKRTCRAGLLVSRFAPSLLVFAARCWGIMSTTAPASQSVLTEQYSIPAHCGFVNCPPAVPFFQCARC